MKLAKYAQLIFLFTSTLLLQSIVSNIGWHLVVYTLYGSPQREIKGVSAAHHHFDRLVSLTRPFSPLLQWAHHTPRVGIVLLFVLSVAMACALWIMGIWQLLLVTQGQTTVEATDNEYYEKVSSSVFSVRKANAADHSNGQVAKSRGITFQNPYDLGVKRLCPAFLRLMFS